MKSTGELHSYNKSCCSYVRAKDLEVKILTLMSKKKFDEAVEKASEARRRLVDVEEQRHFVN